MDNDVYKKTKLLLRQLNYFIAHVVAFMVCNAFLVSTAFSQPKNRWLIVGFVVLWAVGLIYHGLRIYGIDLLNLKNKKTKLLWSWFFKLSGV